jgi:hypothetical protein
MKGFTVQSIDLYDDSENPICCPFCGTKVANGASEEDQWIVGECEHLLFAAHDEGFEYKSTRFEKAIEAAKAGMSEDERDELDNDYDELFNKMNIKNAFYFRSIVGPPAQFSAYIGFAPLD